MERLRDTGDILPDEHKVSGVIVGKGLRSLVILAILLASVALAVALISLTQKGSTSTVISLAGQQGQKLQDERIWTIAIGHMVKFNIYIDEPSGELRGFYVDMINAVCRIANKNCRLMYDIWQRCWDSEIGQVQRGGEGLLGGWYDACAGWVKTYPRMRTFQFAEKWQNPEKIYFVVKQGSNFNPRDITGKLFGFVDGFYNDEFCLARQPGIIGSTLSPSQVRHYPHQVDVYNAVISGEVDACISIDSGLPEALLAVKEAVIECAVDASGGGLMLRMDNPLIDWWNPAQRRLMQTSEYKQICQDIKEEHGHMPGGDPEAVCIGL